MAISEFEIKRCKNELEKFLVEHRPPVHMRDQVDIGYHIKDQTVEIFECRPHWKDVSERIELPVAKATYVKHQKVWKVYWHMSDMKWHRYEPTPTVKNIEGFLSMVGEDKHSCFFS